MTYSQEEIKLIMENDGLKELYTQLLELKLKTDLKIGSEQLSELNEFNKPTLKTEKIITPIF